MPREFPGASYDNWKTANPADAELEYEPEDTRELYECSGCGRFREVFDTCIRNECSGELEDRVYCAECWAKRNNALADLINRMAK